MKVLINYADNGFFLAQQRNASSGVAAGNFDDVWVRNRSSLDAAFVDKNKAILAQPRGAGYWLWKPYIIARALRELRDDDYLFYCDSGCLFINPIDEVIDIYQRELDDMGIVVFKTTMWVETGPPWQDAPEYMWTKRDVFAALDADLAATTHSAQSNGATILLRKRDFAIRFVDDWLAYCTDPHLLTDTPSRRPNYAGYNEHRHDQSLLSVLSKVRGVHMADDITHWGEDRRATACRTVIHHDRYKG